MTDEQKDAIIEQLIALCWRLSSAGCDGSLLEQRLIEILGQ